MGGEVNILEVYLYNPDSSVPEGSNWVRDPEAYFVKTEICCDDTDKQLVSIIDEGTLIDSSRFLDRFGATLYTTQLSTGCKAGLLVNNSDDVIDLRECGMNALSAILSLCKDGRVAMPTPCGDLTDYTDGHEISVKIGSRLFHTMRDVAAFMRGDLYVDL